MISNFPVRNIFTFVYIIHFLIERTFETLIKIKKQNKKRTKTTEQKLMRYFLVKNGEMKVLKNLKYFITLKQLI